MICTERCCVCDQVLGVQQSRLLLLASRLVTCANRCCQHNDADEMVVVVFAMPGVQQGYSAIIYMLKLGINCLYNAMLRRT